MTRLSPASAWGKHGGHASESAGRWKKHLGCVLIFWWSPGGPWSPAGLLVVSRWPPADLLGSSGGFRLLISCQPPAGGLLVVSCGSAGGPLVVSSRLVLVVVVTSSGRRGGHVLAVVLVMVVVQLDHCLGIYIGLTSNHHFHLSNDQYHHQYNKDVGETHSQHGLLLMTLVDIRARLCWSPQIARGHTSGKPRVHEAVCNRAHAHKPEPGDKL